MSGENKMKGYPEEKYFKEVSGGGGRDILE